MVTNSNIYGRLLGQAKTILDAIAVDALMRKGETKSFALLDVMASNNFQWPVESLKSK